MIMSFNDFQTTYLSEVTNHMIGKVKALDLPDHLKESMIYSLQAGGKRLRPLMVLATMQSFGRDPKAGMAAASALEMIHTYSLIHDDLPAMDDDDLRRGNPTNHKVFGEAMAILAGDGLLTFSFQLLAEDEHLPDEKKVELIALLARCAGPEGMVGGQVADIEGENGELTVEELQSIHVRKTGKLLMFSVMAGAIMSDASPEELASLEEFAYHVGLAFQIQDDILDIEGSEELIGKPVGSDESKHKSTYPKLLTMSGAKEKLAYHLNGALDSLKRVDRDTDLLEEIANLIAVRNH
ncbi:polyprenyl synthetase family protein [Rossellomorea marisflavi]|uniref:Farnesyl diphosphate synthase n=1 Tax=Rossellomorea marisflavi TaxID=189381 RepID=A0A5D4S4Q5_9BACI|nr:farnesyl-diphosphate synthase [Bacillus sp. Leaf406]MBV6683739.1 polyprenyl synthetase family protein [Bacillus sp. JRC01]TYS56716.1 polyprenyl synthetase family protein [Rossellomorea marisflavi]UKS63968.1 polyprenyl synthetase family protein [Rossellomorea marisflavi]